MSDEFVQGKRVCTWKLSPELDELLALVARYEDRSKSAVVRRAVLGYMQAGGYLDGNKVPELANVSFPVDSQEPEVTSQACDNTP